MHAHGDVVVQGHKHNVLESVHNSGDDAVAIRPRASLLSRAYMVRLQLTLLGFVPWHYLAKGSRRKHGNAPKGDPHGRTPIDRAYGRAAQGPLCCEAGDVLAKG